MRELWSEYGHAAIVGAFWGVGVLVAMFVLSNICGLAALCYLEWGHRDVSDRLLSLASVVAYPGSLVAGVLNRCGAERLGGPLLLVLMGLAWGALGAVVAVLWHAVSLHLRRGVH